MVKVIQLIALLVIPPLVSLAVEDGVLTLPSEAMDRYSVATHFDTIESFEMERVRLDGRLDITYDPVPGMRWDREANNASAVFVNQFNPALRYSVSSFPADAFEQKFGLDMLRAYLAGKAATLADRGFELVLAPEIDTGKARFRILGQRAISFSYAFTRDGKAITRGENWIQKDGMIHIVSVEAPTQAFPRFFETVRRALNSMRELD